MFYNLSAVFLWYLGRQKNLFVNICEHKSVLTTNDFVKFKIKVVQQYFIIVNSFILK